MISMAEKDVKIKVINWLHKNEKHSAIVPEVTIGHTGVSIRNAARADVFAVNGDISIYEIKTENDTLARLESQLYTYQKAANRVSVVVAEKFIDKLNIDDSIGIYAITSRSIKCIRKPVYKPIALDVLLDYWWGSELKEFLRGYAKQSELHQSAAIKLMQEMLNEMQISNVTLNMLYERYKKESEFIKEKLTCKEYEALFPKRKVVDFVETTSLKELPFGLVNA